MGKTILSVRSWDGCEQPQQLSRLMDEIQNIPAMLAKGEELLQEEPGGMKLKKQG